MKKLGVVISSITAIGFVVKNMGQLTINNVLLYGVVLIFSYLFFRAMWKLVDDDKSVVKSNHDKKSNAKKTQKKSTR